MKKTTKRRRIWGGNESPERVVFRTSAVSNYRLKKRRVIIIHAIREVKRGKAKSGLAKGEEIRMTTNRKNEYIKKMNCELFIQMDQLNGGVQN